MKRGRTTVIRREVTAIGVGLLEQAIEGEGGKGCSPIFCTEPVPLEPPYQTFDSEHVISFSPGTKRKGEEVVADSADVEPLTTFEIYPAEEDILSINWMATMLRALSVLKGRKAFELYGETGRIWVRFGIPRKQVAGFRTAVQGHFPAVRIRQIDEVFPKQQPSAVNELVPVPPYHRTLTLLGAEGASPLALAVDVINNLKEGQKGVFQVLFCPASHEHDWHYNIGNLVEAELRAMKLSQLGGLSTDFSYDTDLPPLLELTVRDKVKVDVAFYSTVIRYAVWAEKSGNTEDFLQGMRVATGMLRFGNRAFRVLSHEDMISGIGRRNVSRLVTQRITHRPGVMLTSQELASVVHLPNDRTLKMLSCIEQRTGFEWASFAADELGEGAANIGSNHYAGIVRSVDIPMLVRLRQTLVGGVTGSGKSNLLEVMILNDARQGVGLCVIDPHGDLSESVLARLPEDRMKDLVYVSFSEPGYVPRWNPFKSDTPPGKLADDIARGFLDLTASTGARMEHNFRMLSFIVHHLGGTLDDFAEIVTKTGRGEFLRERASATISNRQARRFLRYELPRYGPNELDSVKNKLDKLLLDDHLSMTFSQPENDLNPREWMDQGKVVLVNLSSGRVGADQAHFAGGLLISFIHRAALSRADLQRSDRRPFMVYIDEFQNLQTNTLAGMLSEGRKYGLATVLAHQERGQLRKEIAHALGNCATKIVFRPADEDMGFYSKVLGGRIRQSHFEGLGIGNAIVASGSRLATVDVPLCDHQVHRDPRVAAAMYARQNYAPMVEIRADDGSEEPRPRIYDSVGGEDGRQS